jgi:N-acetylated-alpha-linked acidic dipeptidase
MSKFGDPDFEYHATAAKIGAAMLLRLANADVLPYDYLEFARTMRRFTAQAASAIADKHLAVSVDSLTHATGRMEDAANAFNVARDRVLATQPSNAALGRVNASLMRVERALTRPAGLVTRPWFRNLIYASDENNGYATMVFPSVGEAIRLGDEKTVSREIADLASRFDAATLVLQRSTEIIRGM